MVQITDRTTASKRASGLIPALNLDAGNRTVGWLRPNGEYRQIPSIVLELEECHDAPQNLGEDSIYLEFGDRRYLVGQAAKEMGGSPVFLGGKTKFAWLLVAAALEPMQSELVEVGTLRMLCPNSANPEYKQMAESIAMLEWLYDGNTYRRNGERVTVTGINCVQLVDEGVAAWHYLKSKNLLARPNMNTAIIDIGGGDTTIRVITPSGNVDRTLDDITAGTAALAKNIASQLQRKLNYSPDLGAIMDAIERVGTDPKVTRYEIEAEGRTIDFSKQFADCHAKWLKEIVDQVNFGLIGNKKSSQLGQIWICGGSAELAKTREKAGVIQIIRSELVPNFPQRVNVYGMAAM